MQDELSIKERKEMARNDAADILFHYLDQILQKNGESLNLENREDLKGLVDHIIEAAVLAFRERETNLVG